MSAKLIAVKNILHPAGDVGPRITREEFVAVAGTIAVSQFWHEQNGQLVRVSSRAVRPGEVIPNDGTFY